MCVACAPWPGQWIRIAPTASSSSVFDDATFLDGQYTVWGEVTSGMDAVDALPKGEPPAQPGTIKSVTAGISANRYSVIRGEAGNAGKSIWSDGSLSSCLLASCSNPERGAGTLSRFAVCEPPGTGQRARLPNSRDAGFPTTIPNEKSKWPASDFLRFEKGSRKQAADRSVFVKDCSTGQRGSRWVTPLSSGKVRRERPATSCPIRHGRKTGFHSRQAWPHVSVHAQAGGMIFAPMLDISNKGGSHHASDRSEN